MGAVPPSVFTESELTASDLSSGIHFVISEDQSPLNNRIVNLMEPENFFNDDVQVIYAAAAATMESQTEKTESLAKLRLLHAEAIGIRKIEVQDSSGLLQVVYAKTIPNQQIWTKTNKIQTCVKLERPFLITAADLGNAGEMIAKSLRGHVKANLTLLPVEVSLNGPIAVAQSVVCNNNENITSLISRVRALRRAKYSDTEIETSTYGRPLQEILQESLNSVTNGQIGKRSKRGRKSFKSLEVASAPEKPKVKRKYNKKKNHAVHDAKTTLESIPDLIPQEQQQVSPYTLKVKVDASQEWRSPFPVQVEFHDGNNNVCLQTQSYSGNYRITKGLTDLAKAVADVSCLKSIKDCDAQAGAVRSIELEIEPESLPINSDATDDYCTNENKQEMTELPSSYNIGSSNTVNRRKSGIKRFTYT